MGRRVQWALAMKKRLRAAVRGLVQQVLRLVLLVCQARPVHRVVVLGVLLLVRLVARL